MKPPISLSRLLVSLAALAATVGTVLAVSAGPAAAVTLCGGTFSSTGAEQSCMVPGSGPQILQVVAVGGRGGNAADNSSSKGGAGAIVTTAITVAGGSTLFLDVAGDGTTTGTSASGAQGGLSGASASGGTSGCFFSCPSTGTGGASSKPSPASRVCGRSPAVAERHSTRWCGWTCGTRRTIQS